MSDLQKLFSTDPLDLTKNDIIDLVAAYRTQRSQFNLGVKAPSKAKAKVEKIDQIDLDDLLKGI